MEDCNISSALVTQKLQSCNKQSIHASEFCVGNGLSPVRQDAITYDNVVLLSLGAKITNRN